MTRTAGNIFLILSLQLPGIVALKADIIYLNKGEEYVGSLVKIEKDSVWFSIKGEIEKWSADEIQRIEFEPLHEAQWIKELKEPLLDSLWEYGADTLDYPDASSVTLYEKVTYQINPDSSWEKTTRKIQKLLRPRGRWIASKSFYYLSKSENLNIKSAKVINPGGEINWLREAAKQDESIYSRFPQYDNQHRIRFALPEIPPGGICDVLVEQTFPKASGEYPLFIEECFRDWEPVEYKIVEIICPKDIELTVSKSPHIDSKIVSQAGVKTHKFWKTKSDKIEREPWLPPLPDLAPRIAAGIKDDWKAVGDRYYELIESRIVGAIRESSLQNKIRELKTGQKIYNFVATEIKPVPVTQLDECSWIPTAPDSVFQNKSGSLPDRVFLLYAMLKKAGKNVYLVLTSPHANGKRIGGVPALGQFPSFVVEMEDSWLCPVDDCTALGELPSEYQGRLGLKLKPEGSELVEIPVFEPDKERTNRRMDAKLYSNGDLEITEMVEFSGNYARNFRQKKSLKQEELKKYFEEEISRIHPSAELVEFKLSDLANLSEPVRYGLNYKIPNYALKSDGIGRQGDKFLVFNLPGIMYTAEEVGKKERANPLDFRLKAMIVNQIEVEIPKTYEIYYLPRAYARHSQVADYEASFAKKSLNFFQKLFGGAHKVLFKDRYLRKLSSTSPEDYADYKACIETKAKLAKEWIVLKKK